MQNLPSRKTSFRATFILTLSALVWGVSCGLAPNARFRLARLDGELVVVPPPYWKHAPTRPIKLAVPVPAVSGPTKPPSCSIKSSLFRVAARGASSREWRVTLPALTDWQEASRSEAFRKDFDDILDKVDALEARKCIPAGSGRMLAEWMRDSVPVKNSEALFYRNDYAHGQGFIDLEPQMKLGIERAVYGADGKFAGTQTAAYEIERDAAGLVKFLPNASAAPQPWLPAQETTEPDLTLAERTRGLPYYRLFHLGESVPKNSMYAGMVVGTRTRSRMEEITTELKRRWESTCPPESAMDPVDCVLFQGAVTVTGEIGVTVNGKPIFFLPPATVGDALSEVNLSGCLKSQRSLRVLRRFLSGHAPVAFKASDGVILNVQLLAGDRISCGSK